MQEKNAIRDDYNKSAAQELENRLKSYNLTNEERAEIWKITGDKVSEIAKETEYFRENKEALKMKELEKLRGEEQPTPRLTMDNAPAKDPLEARADMNVNRQQADKIKNIEKTADKQINAILQQSKDRDKQNTPDLQKDFQQAHDQDRAR
jgi:hypothetical protein